MNANQIENIKSRLAIIEIKCPLCDETTRATLPDAQMKEEPSLKSNVKRAEAPSNSQTGSCIAQLVTQTDLSA